MSIIVQERAQSPGEPYLGERYAWIGPKDVPGRRMGLVALKGGYDGSVVVEMLEHPGPDLLIRVAQPFTYWDSTGRPWPVPLGVIADGGSFPWIMRAITGHPLEGDHRRGSLVHDAYCGFPEKARSVRNRVARELRLLEDSYGPVLSPTLTKRRRALLATLDEGERVTAGIARTRSSADTHWVFYDACLYDELATWRARSYYEAVRRFGPQWKDDAA